MSLPEPIKSLIDQELNRTKAGKYRQLIRRKAQFLKQADPYELASEQNAKELLADWYAFHGAVPYPSFSAFYSKREFCSAIPKEFFQQKPELFYMLLADRRFLFLEYNEHANNYNYPPLSEIVRDPEYYCADSEISDKRQAEIQNAEIVKAQGFVPTNGHVRTYQEMKENLEEIQRGLAQRKRCLESVKTDFAPFQIDTRTSTEDFDALDRTLSKLFRSYVAACVHQGYEPAYTSLLEAPEERWLDAIHSVRMYLDAHPELPEEHALVFFHLFSQSTKKLLDGKLRTYTFKPIRKSNYDPPKQAQRTISQKKYCNIMLFDYLLELLPPKDDDIEGAKYQFHLFTRYDKYPHFILTKTNSGEFSFYGSPDYKNGVDQLGSLIRHHIFYCIPNYVTWLTPGLPNVQSVDSAELATLLLQDAAKMPTRDRLTDRIRFFLDDPKIGPYLIKEYLAVCSDQSAAIEKLNGWCTQYGFEFTGEDIHADLQFQRKHSKDLCSRFVLEHAIKERALSEARECLSGTAADLLAEYLVEHESFSL